MYGWAGQRLKVYLTEGKIVKEPLSQELRLEYIGARGLNAKVLLDEVQPSIDPLGPDNVFIVGVGPLVGTPMPGAARWTVTAKNPITGGFGDGNGGGHFGAALKFAGYDQIIFYGRSPKPVYLLIDDERVELRDASHLWGKTISETHEQLVEELGDREIHELSIGPAAENLVLMTKLYNDSRAGGKGGMGAVAGSKNLKAVVVRGTKPVKIARPAEFFSAAKSAYKKVMAKPLCWSASQNYVRHDPAEAEAAVSVGTRNGQLGYFEGWQNVTAEAFINKYLVKRMGCFACPIHCSNNYQVKEGPYTTYGSNIQHGKIYPFTSRLGIDKLDFALRAAATCDELGLDTHLTGATISFAMEVWQRGLLTIEDTDGLDLSWGNDGAIHQLIPKIAYREGWLGNLLADGSKKASEQINGASVCLVQTKGMDVSSSFPGPKADGSGQLAYSVATRGPDHLRGGDRWGKGNPKLAKILGEEGGKALLDPIKEVGVGTALGNHFSAFFNSLGMCSRATIFYGYKFALLDEDDLAELFSAVTGVDMNGNDLMKIGERILNVERVFNVREGFRRKDDFPPERFFVERVTEGPGRVKATIGINRAKYEKMLDEYYEFSGWDREGIPTKKKLEELNLSYLAEQV